MALPNIPLEQYTADQLDELLESLLFFKFILVSRVDKLKAQGQMRFAAMLESMVAVMDRRIADVEARIEKAK